MSDDTCADGSARLCLDLFSGLGGFSAAFEDADGWEVVTVDLEERFDPDIQANVLDLRASDLPDADVILVGTPCSGLSKAGVHHHWDGDRPASDTARDGILLAHHAIGLVRALNPDYWVLENPMGKLRKVIGLPVGTVTYCQYGADWMKPTDLWGDIPPTFEFRRCSNGDPCHENPGHSGNVGGIQGVRGDDPAKRAKVPYELSHSILDAVQVEYQREIPRHRTATEQVSLITIADGGVSPEPYTTDSERSGGENHG